jgi:hypothetical protein
LVMLLMRSRWRLRIKRSEGFLQYKHVTYNEVL